MYVNQIQNECQVNHVWVSARDPNLNLYGFVLLWIDWYVCPGFVMWFQSFICLCTAKECLSLFKEGNSAVLDSWEPI